MACSPRPGMDLAARDCLWSGARSIGSSSRNAFPCGFACWMLPRKICGSGPRRRFGWSMTQGNESATRGAELFAWLRDELAPRPGRASGGSAHRRELHHRRGHCNGLSNPAGGVRGLSGFRDQSRGVRRNADHCSQRSHWRHARGGAFACALDHRCRRSRASSALDGGNHLSRHVSGAHFHTRAARLSRGFRHGADANPRRHRSLPGDADEARALAVGRGDDSRRALHTGQSCVR